ncbi:mammalian ependymin-related protein 1-like [Aplysia californica]|uniref:Mammalian ependymin-related protein 1-like n=1 Tax=Aplysia californica TaxID=6500 RepID=A0ABM1VVR3_APLCA|nr:mammalian ependymin-related protein 1-like [Aplysia californica]
MLLILFCATLVVVYAQQPTPCHMINRPASCELWPAVGYKITTYNKLLYFTCTQNKEYKINLKARNCTVGALTRPFIHFGIPPDAKYTGTANVGPVNIPDEHATVILFEGTDRESGGFYYGEVTSPDCVPVASGYYSNQTGYLHTSFYDITGGIPDPSVFIPPSNCVPV